MSTAGSSSRRRLISRTFRASAWKAALYLGSIATLGGLRTAGAQEPAVPVTDADSPVPLAPGDAATTSAPTDATAPTAVPGNTSAATAANTPSTTANGETTTTAEPAVPATAAFATQPSQPDHTPEAATTAKTDASRADVASWVNLRGFIQADYVVSQLSEDQLADGTGKPLNEDRFLIRRARLSAFGHSERHSSGLSLEYLLEAELNTLHEPQIGTQQIEAALLWSVPADTYERLPLKLRLGAGVVPVPFGYELAEQGVPVRYFTERSLMAEAFVPGQLDLGARLSGLLDFSDATSPGTQVEVTFAVQNGQPIGNAQFPAQDPNSAKDVTGRAAVRVPVTDRLRAEMGFSALSGTGFHSGTTPTKETLIWRDFNQDGIVQLGELGAISPSAGAPSQDFERWGVELDARLFWQLAPLGELSVYAEGALGTNLDRGVRPADPITLGRDQRELGLSLGFTQELGSYVVTGFRFDYYRPEVDNTDLQNGDLVRVPEEFLTYTPLVALRLKLAHIEGRLTAECAFRQDPLGRDASGRPTDLENTTFTTRAQVMF